MVIIYQLGIIFLFCLTGDLLSEHLVTFLPGNVLAMLLLFLFLLGKWIKPSQIETVGNFLLKNMPFFFIPYSTGIMKTHVILQEDLPAMLIIFAVSTIITLAATGLTVQAIITLQNHWRRHEHEL